MYLMKMCNSPVLFGDESGVFLGDGCVLAQLYQQFGVSLPPLLQDPALPHQSLLQLSHPVSGPLHTRHPLLQLTAALLIVCLASL